MNQLEKSGVCEKKTPEETGGADTPSQVSSALGILPAQAPLANGYVPFQQDNAESYQPPFGFIRGTLFPGLDLPFMGLVNTEEKELPLNQLQALNFAITELGLYLDTHPLDQEALDLFSTYRDLYQQGLSAYEEEYGPLLQQAAGKDGVYNWLRDPWPWDAPQKEEAQA